MTPLTLPALRIAASASGMSRDWSSRFGPACSLTRWLVSSSPCCTCRVHRSLRSWGCALRMMALEDAGGSMC